MPRNEPKFEMEKDPAAWLQDRNLGIPEDYHCDCEYCTGNFLGEIYCNTSGKYYNRNGANAYLPKNENKHLCPGHFQGYRWPIQQFTKPGDLVFDPTVGSGTAVIEAVNNGRRGFGIELEFADIAQKNLYHQVARDTALEGMGTIVQGDARKIPEIFAEHGIKKNSISLVLNGTPYPKLSGKSSDAPERKRLDGSPDKSFDYGVEENFGLTKGNEYEELIASMYLDCIPYMKKHAKMCIIIKDMIQNKEPYLLHKMIVDFILARTDDLKYFGSYMHKHIPYTLFMSTYPKRFPEVKVPLYQVGIVLEKA